MYLSRLRVLSVASFWELNEVDHALCQLEQPGLQAADVAPIAATRSNGDTPSVALRLDTAQTQSMCWCKRLPGPQTLPQSTTRTPAEGYKRALQVQPNVQPKESSPGAQRSARSYLGSTIRLVRPQSTYTAPPESRRAHDERTTNAQGCGTSGMTVRHTNQTAVELTSQQHRKDEPLPQASRGAMPREECAAPYRARWPGGTRTHPGARLSGSPHRQLQNSSSARYARGTFPCTAMRIELSNPGLGDDVMRAQSLGLRHPNAPKSVVTHSYAPCRRRPRVPTPTSFPGDVRCAPGLRASGRAVEPFPTHSVAVWGAAKFAQAAKFSKLR